MMAPENMKQMKSLTLNEQQEIIKRLKIGESYADLANKYHAGKSTKVQFHPQTVVRKVTEKIGTLQNAQRRRADNCRRFIVF